MIEGRVNPEEYLYLVDAVLRMPKYRRLLAAFRVEYDDAYQIGSIGLLSAVKAYDPERGTFQTIAMTCIISELLMQVRKLNALQRKNDLLAYSLDRRLTYDTSATYLDLVADDSANAAYDDVLLAIRVDSLAAQLGPREKDILQAFATGMDVPWKRKEVLQNMDISWKQFYRSLRKIRSSTREIFFERRQAATC
ncbi:MAG TPA: sigma factor [Selenomonadales bacterium]|nr:sigma factor [Selenomonadales bacterium]